MVGTIIRIKTIATTVVVLSAYIDSFVRYSFQGKNAVYFTRIRRGIVASVTTKHER